MVYPFNPHAPGAREILEGYHRRKRMRCDFDEFWRFNENKNWMVNGKRVEGVRPADCPPFEGSDHADIMPEVSLKADEYFACGDNSPASYDSRYWGPVPARNLRGIAGGVFWPFASAHFGPVK